jgi:uracil-DNA glycosylase
MTKVLFVGDEPSKTNAHKDVAFVGAKCFSTLVSWIWILEPDYYVCINSSTPKDWDKILALKGEGFKIIALGKKAAEVLDELNVSHFQLPHPSGLNRKLNDKEYINRELKVAYDYIHDTLIGVLSEDQRSGAV